MRYVNHHNRLAYWIPFLLFTCISLDAQQSNSMYLLHAIPQSSFLNPAVQIKCSWFLGIPGLSSAHISYSNTAFTYLDLTEGNTWNLEQVEGQMHRRDLYGTEVDIQLLAIGHRHRSNYYSFSLDDRAYLYQTLPGDLVSTAVHGNYPSAGTRRPFNGLGSFGTYLRQYTFGISRVIGPYLRAGIRLKLLFGKAGIGTGQTDMGLYTDENTFDLMVDGNAILNTSLPLSVKQDAAGKITGSTWNEVNYARFLLNRGNPGIAMDLGIIYRFDPKLTLSASLLDVGGLRWRTDPENIRSEGTFVYEEIERNGDVISSAFLEDFLDTLQRAFDVRVSHEAYASLLPAQLFLGASYQPGDKLSLGVVNRNLFLRSKLHSSLSLSVTSVLAGRILGSFSWSYLNRSVKNLGAVLALQGKGFQFHLASDNLLGFFQPFDTRTINFRMGFNVLFGCPSNRKEELEEASHGGNLFSGNCSWSAKQKQRKRRYK